MLENKEVFLVFKKGIYRHECLGVFTHLLAALEIAKKATENDVDDWHSYEVVKFSLNEETPIDLTIKDNHISPKYLENIPETIFTKKRV